MKKSRKEGTFLHIVIALMVIIGFVAIAVYPFPNRNLSMHFVSDKGEYSVEKNNREIADGNCKTFCFDEEINQTAITKVCIYGNFKSIKLSEISAAEFMNYIESVDEGDIKWNDGTILLDGPSVRFQVNDDLVSLMQSISKSCLQERFFFAGYYFCVVMLIWFIINVIKERHTEGNWNNHGPIFEVKKFLGDMKKYRQYIVYAAKTDLKAEVADSYLNRLWWLLQPFFNMLVYVIVFGNVMGNNIRNYATFVFSALLMWDFFSKTINYSVKLVRSNKDIITKVYIPKFVILLSNMILNFIKLLFSMIVLVVMLLIFRVHIGIYILWFIPAYLTMILIAFGLGMIFLHFGVYVDDLSYAVGILINMMMFLSGIFYDVTTTLPAPLNGIMMSLNPVAIAIDTMRNALLYNRAANIPELGMWLLMGIILCAVGVHTVYKNENSYVKVV